MYTVLSDNECWVRYSRMRDKWVVSRGLNDLADALALDSDSLASLLATTATGLWPVLAGGKLFQAISAVSGAGEKTVIISEVPAASLMKELTRAAGTELMVLTTATGRVLGLSERAAERFPDKTKLSGMFESSSSAALEAALLKCSMEGSVREFLVSSPDSQGNRMNYGVRMRSIPGPGRLILSSFSIPSVAVVSGTVDSNSLAQVLLEESFCPNLVIDREGKIISANGAARNFCDRLWGFDPTGLPVFDLVHPDHKNTIRIRHQQRVRGNAVPSRYTIRLQPPGEELEITAEVSVVPLHNLDRWVIFLALESHGVPVQKDRREGIPELPGRLAGGEHVAPEEVLTSLLDITGAGAAVWIHGHNTVTAGDCSKLLSGLDRKSLAARGTGFIDDSTFVRRVDSGYGISHILVRGLEPHTSGEEHMLTLDTASRILEACQLRSALEEERRTLALMRDIAGAFLKRTESLEGLLGEFARTCGAETAAVFRITGNGRLLHGIAGAGLVGDMPDLPLDVLNTASWACLRGETALFTSSQDSDLRFASVFPESLTELAVPFFSGTTPEGAILIASSGRERFNPSTAELAGLLALLFTVPEEAVFQRETEPEPVSLKPVREKAAEKVTHTISAMQWALNTKLKLLDRSEAADDLLETSSRLGFYSRWTLWFLRISMYGGRPDQKWMDPVPLLEKTFIEMKDFGGLEDIDLQFIPPPSDLEVCTDGAFVGMIAASLMMCILENCSRCRKIAMTVTEKGDNWMFSLDCVGDSIPGECLSTGSDPEGRNSSFMLAWKLTEELGGTVSTFSSKGKSTRMVIRLRTSG